MIRGEPFDEKVTIKKLNNLEEVIKREKQIKYKEGETYRASLWIPSTLDILITIIMNKYKLKSERAMYRSCFKLGTILVLDRIGEKLIELAEVRNKLLFHKVESIAAEAARHGLSVGGDTIKDNKRVRVDIPDWCYSELGEISEISGLQISTIRRWALYCSINTIINEIENLPDRFKEYIIERLEEMTGSVDDRLSHFKSHYAGVNSNGK